MALLGADYASSDEERGTTLPAVEAAPLVLSKVSGPQTDKSLILLNTPYSDNSRLVQGPASISNPGQLKRKNIPTGYAQEIYLSKATFDSNQRAYQQRDVIPGSARPKRQKKGDPSIVDGPGEYKGPWAKNEGEDEKYDYSEAIDGQELASDEEWEEEAIVPIRAAPLATSGTAYEEDFSSSETSVFEGTSQYDYQGRTYMHIPQDLDIDLRKEPGSQKNYIPKKHIHTFRSHTKAINALRFFPSSGHLLLSASADTKIKIWDSFHSRELLRTYSGHSRSVTDIAFTPLSGTQFLSAAYDRYIKLWDTEIGVCTARYTTGKTPHCIAWNPSPAHSTTFIAGMSDKKIIQYDTRLPPSDPPTQSYEHHLAPINTLTFVDNGNRFLSTSDDKSLRAWEFDIPVPIKYIAEPHMFSMVRSSLHPSGKSVAFQSADNKIDVYAAGDKFRQNRKKCFRGHNNAGYAIDVDISPDGQFLMSGDSGGYVCFWDWKSCALWGKVMGSKEGAVTACRWHPQETSKVVTGEMGGNIKYWD